MESPRNEGNAPDHDEDGAHDQALLFVHLEGLGPIRVAQGTEAAATVRAEVAARLDGSVRRHDLVVPNGDDGFVVLCAGIRHVEAERLAQRLTACLDDRTGTHVTVRVGAAHGPHELSYHELVGRADAALERARRGGPDRLVIDAGDRLLEATPGSRAAN